MPDPLSLNVQHLKASETVAISNEAKRRKAAGEDVLDLGVGEPDFDTPGRRRRRPASRRSRRASPATRPTWASPSCARPWRRT